MSNADYLDFDFDLTSEGRSDRLIAVAALERITGSSAPVKMENVTLCGWEKSGVNCSFCNTVLTNKTGLMCINLWVELGDHCMCEKCFENHECSFLPRE